MTVKGTNVEDIAAALKIIAEIVLQVSEEAEKKGIAPEQPRGNTRVRLLVHSFTCGGIIGYGGEVVKSIEVRCHASAHNHGHEIRTLRRRKQESRCASVTRSLVARLRS